MQDSAKHSQVQEVASDTVNLVILQKDTVKELKIVSSLNIDSVQASTEVPADTLLVKAIMPAKDGLDVFGGWAAIIGGLAGFIGAIAAFYQLFKKDEDKQKQIDHLASQTEELIRANDLREKHLRLTVKPELEFSRTKWVSDNVLGIELLNVGQLATVIKIEVVEGSAIVYRAFAGLKIKNDDRVMLMFQIPGSINKLKKISFEAEVIYRDEAQFQYKLFMSIKDNSIHTYKSIDL